MKAAGIRIIYSNNELKVHAKIALLKRKDKKLPLLGLLATGNLNENTARFYTDHVLFTAFQPMLGEMEMLFTFLSQRKKPDAGDVIPLAHLLVSPFNLQHRFLDMIDREIGLAQQGKPAAITIKMNNLEEERLIEKLYEASNAGVKINLIIRSICRLMPGMPGQSTNITVRRIVDRYLEHGRVFIFHNNDAPEVYLGSADWMNRNIYRRIEVCFPVYNEELKQEMIDLLRLQWSDNTQATTIGGNTNDLEPVAPSTRSQEAIYHYLSVKQNNNA